VLARSSIRDALGDAGRSGDLAHHLTNPLARVDVRLGSCPLLPAREQRTGPALANVQGEQPGEFRPDRHLTTFAPFAFAVLDGNMIVS
jgi:hypothetical protein